MTTIHLVYPHGRRIAAPDAIGRELGRRLEDDYLVEYHDWDKADLIAPNRGDVLLGHAHPHARTCWRMSARREGWSRCLLLQPFNHDPKQVAFLDRVVPVADLFLAITGSYWFDSLRSSEFAHWAPKMVHVDLAVDRADYPPLKQSVSPPGTRRILYVGHSGWQKNTGYLSEIASLLPDTEFGWIGPGAEPIAGFKRHGPLDFSTQDARAVIESYDLLLTVGLFDANPSTILEAMGWGLVPVCTPQSGYMGMPGIINVPPGDAARAAAIVGELCLASQERLEAYRSANWCALDEHYNWDRFSLQVKRAIESECSPALGPEPSDVLAHMRRAERLSPYSSSRLGRWYASAQQSLRRLGNGARR